MTNAAGHRTAAGQRVWQSAQELFYQEGIRSVGVAEIAKHSAVGKPSLYRNFASKDELAVAYIRAQGVLLKTLNDDARVAFPNDPLAQLRELIRQTAQSLNRTDHRGCPVANAIVEFPDRSHPVRVATDAWKASHLADLTALVSNAGIAEARGLALALHLLIEGAHVAQQTFGDGAASLSLVDSANRLIESYSRPAATN